MMAVDQLTNDIYDSVLFKLFCASVVIHILVLIYYLRYKWHYRSWWEIKIYFPRIIKYVGGLLGILSVIISFITIRKVGSAEVISLSVIHVIIFCSFLTLAAALLAYGFKGRPSPLAGVFAIVISVIICLAARISLVDEPKQRVLAQTVIELFNVFLGVLLIFVSYKDVTPSYLRNRLAHEITQLRI